MPFPDPYRRHRGPPSLTLKQGRSNAKGIQRSGRPRLQQQSFSNTDPLCLWSCARLAPSHEPLLHSSAAEEEAFNPFVPQAESKPKKVKRRRKDAKVQFWFLEGGRSILWTSLWDRADSRGSISRFSSSVDANNEVAPEKEGEGNLGEQRLAAVHNVNESIIELQSEQV